MKENKHKIEFIDKALLIDKEILVIADFHLGYESMLINSGILIPRIEKKETIRNLGEIFEKIHWKSENIEENNGLSRRDKSRNEQKNKENLNINNKNKREIVILGDIKHLFGGFSLEDWKEVGDILEFLNKFAKIVLIRGNHDRYLKALEGKYDVKDFYVKKDICFFHGHEIFKQCYDKKIKFWILGHVHPVVYLSENVKKESFKCFLRGKYKNKEVYVLPAFLSLLETGLDISSGVVGNINIKNFEVYIVGDKEVLKSQKSLISDDHQNYEGIILRFGKVRDLS